MEPAIDQRHRDVHHRETERPLPRRLFGRFGNRWDEVAWHRTTNDFVDKLEAFAAWTRCDIDLHIGKLPMPAALLLQPAVLVHRSAYGLLVGNLRLMCRYLQPIVPCQTLHRRVEMHLA